MLFYAIAIWNAIKIITFKIYTAHMQMVNKLAHSPDENDIGKIHALEIVPFHYKCAKYAKTLHLYCFPEQTVS